MERDDSSEQCSLQDIALRGRLFPVLNRKEFNATSTDEVGNGVMVWGKKVVLFDAKISRENVLYPLITTNFHEEK